MTGLLPATSLCSSRLKAARNDAKLLAEECEQIVFAYRLEQNLIKT